jgi:hypothetical protein
LQVYKPLACRICFTPVSVAGLHQGIVRLHRDVAGLHYDIVSLHQGIVGLQCGVVNVQKGGEVVYFKAVRRKIAKKAIRERLWNRKAWLRSQAFNMENVD